MPARSQCRRLMRIIQNDQVVQVACRGVANIGRLMLLMFVARDGSKLKGGEVDLEHVVHPCRVSR